MTLHLVLVEPAGARNVGSVARLCANFGISQLRLVAPRCDPFGAEARQMAVHGVAHLERATIYSDLAGAIEDCRRVVAATGRLEGPPLPLRSPGAALAWLLAPGEPSPVSAATVGGAALVFGREDRGLSNDELLQAGCLLHIPAASTYPSLNLSHAVAVVLHHVWTLRQDRDRGLQSEPVDRLEFAPRGAIEAALADAEELLLEVGFLHPHTARARMAKLRALLQRATLSENDLALLRGMVCQLRWASRRGVAAGQDL
ncbi:MAG: RNA methyltransferase [Cyanobium sp.]